MAMDHFMEEVVVKHRRGAQDTLYYLANIVMVLSALLGFSMVTSLMMGITVETVVMVVCTLGIAVFLYLRKDQIRTEYEYTFTNGDLDFAQVYNNRKRKNLGTMKVKNVAAFGAVNSDKFRKLNHTPGLERRNWFLNREAELYYFYYQKENKKTMIVFEPSAELVSMIHKYLPQGVQ